MSSDVYLLPLEKKEKLPEIIKKLFPYQTCAIKLHFGEKGNKTYLDPKIAKIVYNCFNRAVLMDSNVLYVGSRTKTKDHINTAKDHGFDFAPIVIADDDGEIEIDVDLDHFDKIKLGKAINDYNNIVVLSHFKGHGASGYGGAFKNLGMGLGSRAGKLAMHSKVSPSIDIDKCVACGRCVEHCPAKAINIKDYAKIDSEKCIGCAGCITECPEGAVKIPFDGATAKEIQQRIVEYAYGAIKNKNLIYINVLQNITKLCDCTSNPGKPLCDDIGILISKDPVAIDKCSLDLSKKLGNIDFKDLNDIDPYVQIKYAEKIGLGTRDYKIKEK